MSQPPHRLLSVALRIFSVLLAIGGLFMIFGSRGLIIRVFLRPPETEVSTLLLFVLKEMGGMVLMVSAMLFLASRDPGRNVAIVDGLIVGLVHSRGDAAPVAVHRGHPANLSGTPRLGPFRGQADVRGFFLLLATTGGTLETGRKFLTGGGRVGKARRGPNMIPASYRPKKKFMQLAIAEAKRARDRGDYPIGAVITRVSARREVVIASAGNRVKTSGSSIKHVELETLKYVSSGYGRYLPDFVLYSTHEPCAMCAGACVWARIGAVVYGVSQEDIAAYGRKRGTEDYKWRACLIPCRLVLEKGSHRIPVTGGFLRDECKKLFRYGLG